MLTCLINQTPVQFMVATVSTTGDLGGKPPPLSARTLTTMGFSGKSEVNTLTQPLQLTILGQTFYHSLLYAPKCPTHLLGRDILSKLNCHISCYPGGTMITPPPDGPWAHPLTSRQMVAIQEPPQRSPPMDIYWLRNMTTPVDCTSIQDIYLLWKAWILQQGDYHDPIDPPHTMLNASTAHDDVYQETWDQDMEGTSRSCTYREIYLGPEGVVAATILDTTIPGSIHRPRISPRSSQTSRGHSPVAPEDPTRDHAQSHGGAYQPRSQSCSGSIAIHPHNRSGMANTW